MKTSDIVSFIFELKQLRLNKREGWRLAGIAHPESLADHSLRAAQIGFILAKMEGYKNPHEVCTQVVFHEIAEARIGDIHKLANRYVTYDEAKVVEEQTENLAEMGKEILNMWIETDKKTSPAGIIAKDADLLELAFTAREYQELGHSKVSEWLESVSNFLRTDSAKKIFEELLHSDPYDWFMGLKKF